MILVDCRLISEKPTGISNFIVNLSAKFNFNEVFYIVNKYDSRLPSSQLVVDFRPFNIIHFVMFSFWLKKLKPDVYLSLFYSGSLFRLKSTKSFIVIHDLMYKFVPGFFGNKLLDFIGRIYFDLIVNHSIKCSDMIFSVSESTKQDVYRFFKKESIVIGEGTTLDISDDTNCNDNFRFPYFLYVGNSRPHKGLQQFILGYKLYKDFGGANSLVIVGNNKAFNMEDVVSLGFVDDDMLSKLYHNASALVFPSLYEGFGLPILDALNHQIPIYCNNIPAFKEFEHHNIRYFNVNSPKNIAEILNLDVEFDLLKSKAILNRFDWENTSCIIQEHINGK